METNLEAVKDMSKLLFEAVPIEDPHPYELKARFKMEGLMIEGKDYKAGDYYLADLLRGNAGIRED